MSRWKIWYADGTTFDSGQGSPADAPRLGVACVQTEDGRFGRRTHKYCDYYVWSTREQRWFEADDAAALVLRALQDDGIIAVAGIYQRDDDFERILITADNDTFLPMQPASEPPHPVWKREPWSHG